MPYIGRELDSGNYLKLDDISSSFNGSTTTFNLTAAGKAFFPGSSFSILVVLAGVIQEPNAAYQINNSQITFASAPASGAEFYCIVLGVAHGINVPGNGTVDGTKLAGGFNYDGYFYLDDTNNRVGIGTANPAKPLDVAGEGQFGSVRVLGDLTVDGTTTTLDTVVTEVDRLEVGANNSTVGAAITQSGSGDILNLYDGSTEVFSVADGGNVFIGNNADRTSFLNASSNNLQIDGGVVFEPGSGNDVEIYNYRTTAIKIGTGGAEKVRIDSSGDVGIGLTIPNKNSWNKAVTLEGSSNCAYELSDSGTLAAAFALQGDDRIELINFRAGPLTFKTQNTERLRITSAGNIGIGTNSAQTQLEVFGSSPIIRSKHSTAQKYIQINHNGADGYLDWSSGNLILRGASDTERLRIDSNGNMGLGATDPGDDPAVGNAARVFEIRQTTTGNISAGANRRGAVLRLKHEAQWENGYQNSATDDLGRVEFVTGDGSVGEGVRALIRCRNLQYYNQQDLTFEVGQSNSATVTERLRITHDGKVGINESTPTRTLSIDGSVNIQSGSRIESYSSSGNLIIQGGSTYPGGHIHMYGGSGDDMMTFNTSGGGASSIERMRITSAGNVGIGITTPSSILHTQSTGQNQLRISSPSGSYRRIIFHDTTGTKYNFQVAVQEIDNGIHIGPSSAAGNLTFSGSTGLVINSSGTAGIGKITPSSEAQLDVLGSSYWPILVKTSSAAGGGVAIKNKDDVTSLYVGSGGSSWLTGSAITDGLIRAQNDLIFACQNVETMRITSSGNLLLEKNNNAYFNPEFEIYNSNSGAYGGSIRFTGNLSGSKYEQAKIRVFGGSNTSDGSLAIHTGDGTEKFRINSSGNVGIGTNVITDLRRLQVHADNSIIKISSTGAAAGHYAQLEFKTGTQDSAWIWQNPPQQNSHGGPGSLAFYQSTSGAGYRFYTLGSNTRFDIDSSGNITKPNNPAFGVWKNVTNWNIAANTIFDFDQAYTNRGSHFNTSNHRFTAPVSGIYQINFHTIIYTTDQSNAYIQMKVNGSGLSPGGYIHWSSTFNSARWHNVSYSRVVYLTANDYLEMWNGSVAANYHGGAWCYWSGYLAG